MSDSMLPDDKARSLDGPGSLTLERTLDLLNEFIAIYPVAGKIDFRIRATQEELYGPQATRERVGFISGGYVPATRGDQERSPAYRGRCDLAYSSFRDEADLGRCLHHEVAGHFGFNTCQPAEKQAVLDAILLSRQAPGIDLLWERVVRNYADQTDLKRAEELYCTLAEELATFPAEVFEAAQTLDELGRNGPRIIQIDELRSIVAHVATGLHENTRDQVIFPVDRRAQFSKTADKPPFHEVVAQQLIRQIEAGTAPWQKPWSAEGALGGLPTNPVSGKRYRGINAIHLMAQGRSDPRWLTYKQAVSLDAQVKKGERGTAIQYWKFEDTRVKTDAMGQPVLGPDGKPEQERYRLQNPRVFYATVFNAEQIDGLAPWTTPEVQWDPVERAEFILAQSGASLLHSPGDRAFYSLARDEIHLPLRSQFPSPGAYYATALHELGHWSGHETRLKRDLSHPFGSEGYAREELRAEIASMILGAELGLGHDPSRHASYVASWVSVLQKDPLEIFRAAADAEKIHGFVMGFAQNPDQGPPQSPAQTPGTAPGQTPDQTLVRDPDPLKFQADPGPVRSAASQESSMVTSPSRSLRPLSEDDVRDALSYISANLGRDEWARIGMSIKSEFPGESGLALFDQWSATGEGYTPASVLSTWKSIRADGPISIGTLLKQAKDNGYTPRVPLDSLQTRRQLEDPQAAAQRAADAAAQVQVRLNQQEAAAVQALTLWNQAAPGASAAYLERKAVQAHGTRTTEQGTLLVPMVDQEGNLWNVQRVLPRKLPTGVDKLFLRGGRKSGLFHVIGAINAKQPLVMAEGYATAASVHEATGWPCVVCFDAGNLVKVTEQFKQRYPDALLVVAGDDDLPTFAKKGKNPGREKATLASQKASAALAFPLGLNPDQSDFNDLVASLGTQAGGQQIRASFEAALQAYIKPSQTPNTPLTVDGEPRVGQLTPQQALAIKALNGLTSLNTATPQNIAVLDAPEIRPHPTVQASGIERVEPVDPTGALSIAEQTPARFEVLRVGEFTQEKIGEFGQLSSAVYFAAGQDDAESLKILRNGTLLTSPQLSAYLEAMVLERTSPVTSPGPQRLEELHAAALSNPGPVPLTVGVNQSEAITGQPLSEVTPASATDTAAADQAAPPSSQITASSPITETPERLDPYNDLDLQALNAKRAADAQRTRQEMGQAAASSTSPEPLNSITADGPTQEPSQDGYLYQELRTLRERLSKEYQHDGQGKYYFREGSQLQLAFEDKGAKLNTAHHAPEVVSSIAQLAHAKGWKQLTVSGTPEFRREMWLQASLLGMQVFGYAPEAIDLARLSERRAVMTADQSNNVATNKSGDMPNTVSAVNPELAPSSPTTAASTSSADASSQSSPAVPSLLSRQAAQQLDAQLRTVLSAEGAKVPQAVDKALGKLYAQIKSPRVYIGQVVAHGPGQFPQAKDPNAAPSYFVKLKTAEGEKIVWGVDLPRALDALEQQGQSLDKPIMLAFQGKQTVQTPVPILDVNGKVTGSRWEAVERNTWLAQSVSQTYAISLEELKANAGQDSAPTPAATTPPLRPPAPQPIQEPAGSTFKPRQAMQPLIPAQDRLRKALTQIGADPLETEITFASLQSLLDSPKFQVGKLLEHGEAPLHFSEGQSPSYFMRLGTDQGEVLLWSSDFPRAMDRNPVQLGQTVVAAYRGIESVPSITGQALRRNDWLVAPLQSLHDDAQQGVIHRMASAQPMTLTEAPQASASQDQRSLYILREAMRQAGIPQEFALATMKDAEKLLGTKFDAPSNPTAPGSLPGQPSQQGSSERAFVRTLQPVAAPSISKTRGPSL